MHTKTAARRNLCLGSTALAITLAIVSPALADTASDAAANIKKPCELDPTAPCADTIIVTGTRVSQKVSDQPVQTITGQVINDMGYTNIGQALTSLPVFGVPGNSPVGAQGSFGAGQTFINLYNLGSQRTLTLVNGNRFVGAATSSLFGASVGTPVDLGTIAPGLVQSIDIVSVGGAPIYGADAIAGTVNVILKHDYQGIELTSSDGISEKGDGHDYNFSLLAGKNFAGGRGNITLNVYYDHQDGLTTAQRDVTGANANFYDLPLNNSPYQNIAYTGGLRYNGFPNTGIPLAADSIPFYFGPTGAGVTNAAGQTLYFNNQGKLVPFVNGTPTGTGYTEGGGSGFPIGNFGNLLTNSNRIQGTLLGHFDVSDHLRVHGELWWGRNTATNVEAQPYYSTDLFGPAGTVNGNLALSTANPFLSAADRATLQAAIGTPGQDGTFYLARANTDLATGAFTSTSYLFRSVGGIDGDFMLGTHSLRWDVTLNYGQSTTTTRQTQLVTQNFYNAIGETVNGGVASGTMPCAAGYTSAAIATLSSTCAPLDIFGLNNASQAAIDYVTAIATTHQIDTQFDFVADLKGDLVHLPAGDVKFAVGVEARRESQNFDPGAFFRGQLQSDGTYTQYGNSIPITPVTGSYHTHEAFGELTVPLIGADQHIPLVHELTFHGAGRYTDNSLNGGFFSYTAGGNYAPVAGITFRGNYTRSFREPAVTEAFAPTGSVFEGAVSTTDPCDKTNVTSGPNPATRAANCAAAGINTATFISNIDHLTIEGSSGGNTHLNNELSKSWTFGVQANPGFIRGLKLTADYVSITITNEITEPGIAAELQGCYDSSNYPNNPYCSTFTRDASGQISNFTDNFTNIGVEAFRALQMGLDYSLPLSRVGLPASAGAFNISATYLHTYRHYTKLGTQDQQLVLGDRGDPVDAINGNFHWMTKTFDWLWTVVYYGPTEVDPNAGANTYEYPRISPYWMVNTSVGLRVNEHFDLRLQVNNVFNLGVTYAGTVPEFSTNREFDAIMGRYFRMTARVRF
ncbi:TonB-dependent receptor domain-containing protein [Novosphingobium sp. FSW06-99]|uniref:TonB-dependent receptor domain-containing protein n=1 Tax=Novosphingobium sp. FSW06-99 TaxID=1739113 RepID=UPI00076D5304|nr:TonB-dependent receptor [Novosphingobium sp. FSW06-99]KUR80966.1 TonB-dependent receptor [Novosphingobium sp. FSW06-99]